MICEGNGVLLRVENIDLIAKSEMFWRTPLGIESLFEYLVRKQKHGTDQKVGNCEERDLLPCAAFLQLQ